MTQDRIAQQLKTNELPAGNLLTEKLLIYMELLEDWNQRMDLTSVMEEDEMLDRHFIDSLSVLKTGLLAEGCGSLVDVGTGAGFPGMVPALALPDTQVTLIDAQQKRLSFLAAVCEKTGTKNVQLIHGRAEDCGKKKDLRERFDIAAARALAPLDVLCEYMLPFVCVGGKMICWKGPALKEELESGRKAAHLLGGRIEMPERCSIAGRDWEHYLLPVAKIQRTPAAYPRRAGMPKEKPLGR